MKNIIMKITILILVLIVLFSNCKVYADRDSSEEVKKYQEGIFDPISNPDSWKTSPGEEPELFRKAGVILGVVNVVGVVASVIALLVIGIKYMTGSIEEKADYKQALAPYALGAIFLFASTTIANVIYNFATGMLK